MATLNTSELLNAMLVGFADGMESKPLDPPVHGRDYAYAYNRGHAIGLKGYDNASATGDDDPTGRAKAKAMLSQSYHGVR